MAAILRKYAKVAGGVAGVSAKVTTDQDTCFWFNMARIAT